MAASNRVFERKRYSATPIQRRKRGVAARSRWSYGWIPRAAQQSTMARRARWELAVPRLFAELLRSRGVVLALVPWPRVAPTPPAVGEEGVGGAALPTAPFAGRMLNRSNSPSESKIGFRLLSSPLGNTFSLASYIRLRNSASSPCTINLYNSVVLRAN